jgi:TnpA family transposase
VKAPVFGLFKILGYRFAPRFRDLPDQRFWRAELPDGQTSHYGPLEPIVRNRVNLKKDRKPVAGHAPGGRLADHQPGPGL